MLTGMRQAVNMSIAFDTKSRLCDRQPYLHPTHPRARVKRFAITLEVRRVHRFTAMLHPRLRQPFVPDGEPDAADRGVVFAVSEYGVALRRGSLDLKYVKA